MPCCAMIAPIRKRDQQHDRHGLPADPIEMVDRRCESETPRVEDDAPCGDGQRAEHFGKGRGIGAKLRKRTAGRLQHGEREGRALAGFNRRACGFVNRLEQSLETLRHGRHFGAHAVRAAAANNPFEQPGAVGIELADGADIDHDGLQPASPLKRLLDQRLGGGRGRRRPHAGRLQAGFIAISRIYQACRGLHLPSRSVMWR